MDDSPTPNRMASSARILAACLAVRIVLDGGFGVSFSGLNVMRLATPLLGVGLFWVAWSEGRRSHQVAMAAVVAFVVLGFVRGAPGLGPASEAARLLILPAVVVSSAAIASMSGRDEQGVEGSRETPLGARGVAVGVVERWVLVALGLMATASVCSIPFDFAWDAVEGQWRLRGVYANVHNLALPMAMGVVLAVYRLRAGDRWTLLVLIPCLVALYFTYARSSWIFAVVGLGALARGTWNRGWLVASVALGLALCVVDPLIGQRMWDLIAPLSRTGDVLELGTGRLRMWTTSAQAFGELSWWDWVLGSGVQGYHEFWKPKNPGNELLVVLYQFGFVGVLVVFGLWALALDRSRRQLPWNGELFALILAVGIVSLLTDGVISRVTPAWISGWLIGTSVGLWRGDGNS